MRIPTLLAAALCAAGLSLSALAADGSSAQCNTRAAQPLIDLAYSQTPQEAGRSFGSLTLPESKSAVAAAMEMADLHAWLSLEAAALDKDAGLSVQLARQERYQIGDIECADCAEINSSERRYLVGIGKPLGLKVGFAGFARGQAFSGSHARGALRSMADGGFVWSTTIRSEGAHALRVVFEGLTLPDDAELYVYNRAGEAFGPYTGRGINDSGTVVANAITGDTVNVQLRYYGSPRRADLAALAFNIAEVGHIGSRFLLAQRVNGALRDPAKSFCSYNANCVENGDCFGSGDWSPIDSVRRGVAHMLFRSGGGYYICSGGLLNNTSANSRPLFLTANHCISRDSEATSLETFWDFRSPCNSTGACDDSYTEMRAALPTTLGATLLAHGTSGDYSLMELAAVPSGSRTFLGFSSAAVANSNGTPLHRLSHPGGAPQAYSSQNVTASSFTCSTLSRGPFIYSQDTIGATEGGSSGSPILNASGQVVGQLYGACGSNLNNVCDDGANRTVDGAMASYYPNVDDFLDPQGGPSGSVAHVASIVMSRETMNGGRTRGVATVTVRDANNQLLAGATVAGNFSGFFTNGGSAVTGSNGVAVIRSSPKKGTGSFGFCVTAISGTNMSYNAGANVETCDSL